MFKEVTPEEADKLAEAGLLWYDCRPYAKPGDGSGYPRTHRDNHVDKPSSLYRNCPADGYKFFILTEE